MAESKSSFVVQDMPPDPPLLNNANVDHVVHVDLHLLVPLEEDNHVDLPVVSDVVSTVLSADDPLMLPPINSFKDFDMAIAMLANNKVPLYLTPSLLEFVKSKKMSLQQMLSYKYLLKKPFLDDLVDVKIAAFKKVKNKSSVSWAKDTCKFVVERLSVEELKLARKAGCPWTKELPCLAAQLGKLACLKYAIQNGCKWNKDYLLFSAAVGGDLECVQYALEVGCDLVPKFYLDAVNNEHLHLVKFAYNKGCPWHEKTALLAVVKNNLDILRFLVENECFIDHRVFDMAISPCLEYLLSVPDFTPVMKVKVSPIRK